MTYIPRMQKKRFLAVIEDIYHKRIATKQCDTLLAAKQFCGRNITGDADFLKVLENDGYDGYHAIVTTKGCWQGDLWTDSRAYRTRLAKEVVLGFLYCDFTRWTWFESIVRRQDDDWLIIQMVMARYEGCNFLGKVLTATLIHDFAQYVYPRIAKKIRRTTSPIICAN